MAATSSTLNEWLNELSASMLKSESKSSSRTKKLQDSFRRQVRRHTNGRTNQFEVIEHLDGLEEKFQVLSLDNLADALHVRRNELNEFQNHWIPDVLDLFLRLSGDPAQSERLLELYRVPLRTGTPPPLKWKDIIADSPINKKDQLWRVPNFRDTDDSGYEDDFYDSDASLKAKAAKGHEEIDQIDDHQSGLAEKYLSKPALNTAALEQYRTQKLNGLVSEKTFIREALFLLKDLPSQLFLVQNGRCQIKDSIRVGSLSKDIVKGVVHRLNELRKAVSSVRSWTSMDLDTVYVAVMQDVAKQTVRSFDNFIDMRQQILINPPPLTVASIITMMVDLEHESYQVRALAEFLEETARRDDIDCLKRLYEIVQVKQLCADQQAFSILSAMLWQSLELFLKPIIKWVSQGLIEQGINDFFVARAETNPGLAELWHRTFELRSTGRDRSPEFLQSTEQTILACGKTSAFLSALGLKHEDLMTSEVSTLNGLVNSLRAQSFLPVAAAFEQSWHDTITDLLRSRTKLLKEVLTNQCGLQLALDGLETIYLGLEPDIFHGIERKVFNRIDRCHDNWNDRFELTAMFEDISAGLNKQAMFNSLSIHSAYTSSRTMQSRRSSVKILNALSFRYSLPWPVANVIEGRAMVVYGQIALFLMQIKRAKYLVEKVGYMSAMHQPLGKDCGPAEQKYAQVLSFQLLTFVNTLTTHLMMTTIEPRTVTMRKAMLNAASVDDMIRIHKEYIFHLEYSCLVATKFKVIHQSLIALLDLCVRFSDLVSQSSKIHDDGEAHSFTSARSKARTALFEDDSESDNDQHIEGYSSFIVLDDDSSIFKELSKAKHHFEKHLTFVVAGLKAAATAGQHVSELGLLADRLRWNFDRVIT